MAAKKPLRVLVLEDVAADAELNLRQLRKAGHEVVADLVCGEADFAGKLNSESYDLILSDYRLPNWNGLEALRHLRKTGKDIPFILITGTIGEEAAARCVIEGAADYLLKGHLARLPHAVHRVLEQKETRETLRKSEEMLRLSQKIEAIGRLAGGIAHDFNNLLGVILGYSDLLLDSLDPQDPRFRKLDQIKRAAERGASLTRQLLAFSRKQVLEPRILDLNTLVTDMGDMLQRLLGEDVNLVSVPAPSLGQVKVDPGQIEQVIMNLAMNARDAMPTGGALTIETANVELDQDYFNSHVSGSPGPYVMLAVSDTGTGMDAATQAQIFEPFFTTKEKGKGTGLGLATVYGVVKQSGGYIWVYSEPGHGTTFKVYFPRVVEAESAEEVGATPEAAPGGSETIPLVEDAEPLRELARLFLEGGGYTVLEAGSGPAALEMARRYNGPIHLLVTDVIMPGMSGAELAKKLCGERPGLKTIFISGYTDDAIAHHGVLASGVSLLVKPFTRDALTRKVREVLDRPEPSKS